jgi:hypothetical protein
MQTVRGTQSHTRGLEPGIDTIFTKIALDHLALLGIPLRRSPRTCGHTGLATDAQAFVYGHNAVGRPFLHGARGARSDTPRVLAMEAGHEVVRCPGQSAYHFGAHRDDLTEPGTDRKPLIALTSNFTAMTSDAFFGILKQIILTH